MALWEQTDRGESIREGVKEWAGEVRAAGGRRGLLETQMVQRCPKGRGRHQKRAIEEHPHRETRTETHEDTQNLRHPD